MAPSWHDCPSELGTDLERERRERGELEGEDERRVPDGGARVLGPGRGVGRFDADGDEGPDDRSTASSLLWTSLKFDGPQTRYFCQKRQVCQ